MKKIFTLVILFFLVTGFVSVATIASATAPSLSVSSTGSGDNIQINFSGGDPSMGVLLFYTSSSYVNIGTADASGNFSTTISSASNGFGVTIASNSTVYAKTGINGVSSNSVVWPYVQSATTTTTLTLSQSAVLLNAGQTSTITAGANYLYLYSNSQPTIANINLNANQITVTANTFGSTIAKICVLGSTTNCASVTITVQNSGAQQLNFSQNNFSIYSGQNVPVTITGGSGSYIISNNSNPTSVQANLSGSVITLTASTTSGADSITVCTTDMANCGVINVSATTVNSTAVTFSQSNPVVPLGQSVTVTIYGGTGNNFYVSSNSNPSIVQANINGNILTLIGNASTGTSAISICAYAGSCSSLTANVSNVSSGGAISLSQSSISILAGQSSNITISGGSAPYSISSNSPNVFSGVIAGNILTIYGINPGSSIVSICASAGCTTLNITITSVNSTGNPPAFSQNNILLNVGQQTTVNISGTGNYYIANNTNTGTVSVAISVSSAVVSGLNAGTTNISICQSNSQCATLYATVNNPVPVTPIVPTVPVVPVIPQTYVFIRYLGYGDKGDDVLRLQQFFFREGLLPATPNGRYGPATQAAVKKFQKANGIKQTGNVGPSTMSVLNKMQISTPTTDASKQQQILAIQQMIQQLLAQVSQIQGQ